MIRKGNLHRVSIYFLVQLLILFICIFVMFYLELDTTQNSFQEKILIIGWLSNIVFLCNIYMMYRIKRNILDLSIIFFLFFFLFSNGQILLYSLGIEHSKMLVFRTSSFEEIFKASKYFLFSMIVYGIGAIIPMTRKKEMNDVNPIEDKRLLSAIRDTSIILIIISVVPYFYIFGSKSLTSIMYGYSALYRDNTQVSGIIGYISKLFIPAIFMLLYVKYNHKILRNVISFFLLLIAFVGLFSGNRGDGFSIIITLLIFKQLYGKEYTGKNIVQLVVITVFILMIIPVLASFRGIESRRIADFGDIFMDNLTNSDNNFLVSSISELGGTMYSFVLTQRAVPSIEGFHYGSSYVASILMIIPSQFMGGFSFAKYAALDIWLQNVHNMGYGPGFSITSETYYNFGWIGGIAFSFFIGYFFTKMFNLKSKDNNKNEVLRLLSVIFLYNSIIVARFPFHNTIRNIVYIYIIPYLIIMTLYRRKCRNKL